MEPKDKPVTMIEYRGMRIQAERMEVQPVESLDATIEVFLPTENKLLVLRVRVGEVFKIPVQGSNGQPFSYHVPCEFAMEVQDK